MAGRNAHLSERDGAKFLDCDLCVEHLLRGYHRREPDDPRARREQARRPGLFAHAETRRRAAGVVCKAGFARAHSACRHRFTEYHLLVGEPVGIDIRLPLGILFLLLGSTLVVYGAASDPSLYRQSLGINVNLYWGVVLLAFGALMFALSRRAARAEARAHNVPQSQRSGERGDCGTL